MMPRPRFCARRTGNATEEFAIAKITATAVDS